MSHEEFSRTFCLFLWEHSPASFLIDGEAVMVASLMGL